MATFIWVAQLVFLVLYAAQPRESSWRVCVGFAVAGQNFAIYGSRLIIGGSLLSSRSGRLCVRPSCIYSDACLEIEREDLGL